MKTHADVLPHVIARRGLPYSMTCDRCGSKADRWGLRAGLLAPGTLMLSDKPDDWVPVCIPCFTDGDLQGLTDDITLTQINQLYPDPTFRRAKGRPRKKQQGTSTDSGPSTEPPPPID